MKKILFGLAALFVLAAVGCDGSLHNTPLSEVSFELVNFPMPDGEYSIAGNFYEDSWANGERSFDVVDGAGEYTDLSKVIVPSFTFTIVTTGTWDRPWLSDSLVGNEDDYGQPRNITIDIPMGRTIKIIIDGSVEELNNDAVTIEDL
jgi:hypothetical protein